VPLFIWPVAVAVRQYWSSVAVRTAAVIAVLLSIESAVSYNLNHVKVAGAISTTGSSGWRLNLAFPLTASEWNESTANIVLLVAVTTLIVLLAMLPLLRRSRTEPNRSSPKGSRHWALAAAVMMALGMPIVATIAHGRWTDGHYMMDEKTARQLAAERLVDNDCRVCFTSRRRSVEWQSLDFNPANSVRASVLTQRSQARIDVSVPGDELSPGFGRIRVDFGDSSVTAWMGIVDRRSLVHTYEQPGEYQLTVWLQLRNGDLRVDRQTVSVTAGG
jgi:hypothetical protein